MPPPNSFNFNSLILRSDIADTDEIVIKRGSGSGMESRVPYSIVKAAILALVEDGSGGVGAVISVAGRVGIVVLTKADVGLSAVDNIAAAAMPVSSAQAAAIATRQKKTVISPDAPVSPEVGDEWIETTTGIKWTWFDDGDSTQWVELSAGAVSAGIVAMFPRASMASLPSGWIECDGNNGTPDEADVGSMAVIMRHGGLVAAPTFLPDAGPYPVTQLVAISSLTPGVVIKYTTDGSTPSRSHGTLYSGGPVSVSVTTTIKAIAYRAPTEPGMTMIDSFVATSLYNIT